MCVRWQVVDAFSTARGYVLLQSVQYEGTYCYSQYSMKVRIATVSTVWRYVLLQSVQYEGTYCYSQYSMKVRIATVSTVWRYVLLQSVQYEGTYCYSQYSMKVRIAAVSTGLVWRYVLMQSVQYEGDILFTVCRFQTPAAPRSISAAPVAITPLWLTTSVHLKLHLKDRLNVVISNHHHFFLE